MEISEIGINLIKQFEGCRLKSYKCPAGIWTIGYGHTKDVKEGLTITQEKAEALLKQDLKIHCKNVSNLVKIPLKQNEFDALVSFEYNVGYGNFSKSTMLKLINSGNKKDASDEFDKWIYVNGKEVKGLKIRRAKEKAYFIST